MSVGGVGVEKPQTPFVSIGGQVLPVANVFNLSAIAAQVIPPVRYGPRQPRCVTALNVCVVELVIVVADVLNGGLLRDGLLEPLSCSGLLKRLLRLKHQLLCHAREAEKQQW